MLLREEVPIRQLGPILETLGDYAPRTKDPIVLAEYVRQRLARTICTPLPRSGRPAARGDARSGVGRADSGGLRARRARAVDSPVAAGGGRRLPADRSRSREARRWPAIRRWCWSSPRIRPALKQMTAAHLPQLVVLSYNEITPRHEDRIGGHGLRHEQLEKRSSREQSASYELDRTDASVSANPNPRSLILNRPTAMELRTYRAATMHEALALVRRELGPDAAVLHTREVRSRWLGLLPGPRQIEVTASRGVNVPSRLPRAGRDAEPPAEPPARATAAGRAVEPTPSSRTRCKASSARCRRWSRTSAGARRAAAAAICPRNCSACSPTCSTPT